MSIYTRAVIAALVFLVSVNQLFGMMSDSSLHRAKKFILAESFFEVIDAKELGKAYDYSNIAKELVMRIENQTPDLEIYCNCLLSKKQVRGAVLSYAVKVNISSAAMVWIIKNVVVPYKDFHFIGKILVWAIVKGDEQLVQALCTQYSAYVSPADLKQAFESLSIVAFQSKYLANRFYDYLVRALQCKKIERALSSHHSGMASPKALIP